MHSLMNILTCLPYIYYREFSSFLMTYNQLNKDIKPNIVYATIVTNAHIFIVLANKSRII